MRRTSLVLVVSLSILLFSNPATAQEAPPAQPPAPQVLTADTPMTTVAGNAFIAPAGWSVSVKDRSTIVEPPEGNSRVVLVDLAVADADAAVAAAWAQYAP